VLDRGLTALTKLLAPVAPHLCEELWVDLGGAELIAVADWPEPRDLPADYEAERRLVDDTREDVRHIVSVADIADPETVTLAVAPAWKHRALAAARDAAAEGDDVASAVREAVDMEREGAGEYLGHLVENARSLPEELAPERERAALERARWLLEREFDAAVRVVDAAEAGEWAESARPGKPAIDIA
jgi:leucyl-tRNA synthetase